MSKTVFDHLSEQIDSLVKGRRYIIAEIGKLKVSIEEIKDLVSKGSGGEGGMGALVNDLKNFMQRTIGTLGELKNTVTQLSTVVKTLQGQVQQLQQSGVRAGGAPSAAPAPTYAAPAPTPTYTAPAAPAPTYAAPAPAPTYTAPAPAAAPAPSGGAGASFDRIFQAAESGTPAKDIGGMIDALRTALSKANPLNPILFELSMEAGRLKSLGANPLDANNLQALQGKVEKWKSKS